MAAEKSLLWVVLRQFLLVAELLVQKAKVVLNTVMFMVVVRVKMTVLRLDS